MPLYHHENQTVSEAPPALQMLDMLGVPRVQVYRTLFIDLRAKLEGTRLAAVSSECFLANGID